MIALIMYLTVKDKVSSPVMTVITDASRHVCTEAPDDMHISPDTWMRVFELPPMW